MENVPLRRDALRFVETPIDVRCGLIGRIKLKIPVSRLRSEPWSIVLEKVYIVTGPQRFEEYDQLKEDALAFEIKLAALDGIESEWRALQDAPGNAGSDRNEYYPSYSNWMAYGTSFIGTIVENLQVQIRDVHVRYEDDVSFPDRSFACGFSVESLTANTCDENWTPKFVYREQGQNMAYKMVEMTNMAAYLNTDAEMYGDLSPTELKAKMAIHPGNYSTNEFILNPVSASATIKRNCSEKPLNSKKTPRMICDLQLNSIPLEVSDKQYQSLVCGLRSLHQLGKQRRHWKLRPVVPIKGNAKAWWLYVITVHLQEIKLRNEAKRLDVLLQKSRDNVQYVEAFKRYLMNPMGLDLSSKEIKSEQDASRSYEELKLLREIAVFYLKKELSEINSSQATEDGSNEAQSLLQRWFPLWGGWYGSEEDSPQEDIADKSLEGEIMDALADEANLVPYKDVVFAQLGFTLKRGTIQLFSKSSYSNDNRTAKRRLLFEYEFAETKVEFETRPRTKSLKFNLSLGGMYLRDKITPDSVFPLLISPQNVQGAPLYARHASGGKLGTLAKSLSSLLPASPFGSFQQQPEEPLFYLLYERRPFGTNVDFRLHLKSQPLNIVYNPTVVKCVTDFFKIPEELNRTSRLSEKIRSAAFSRIEEAKQRTKEELRKNISSLLEPEKPRPRFQSKIWDIAFELSAPQILIPEHFIDRDSLIMVLDFGKLHLKNDGHDMIVEKEQQKQQQQQAEGIQKYFNFYPSQNQEESDSEDEEFLTPASSPLTPVEEVIPNKKSASLVEAKIMEKIYDRYTVSLSDMQVIVGRVKDNWKHAHLRGSSQLHILDKFSISLNCERRTVDSSDSNLPNVVISGTLPKLIVHVNEDKVHTLERMTRLLIGDIEKTNEASKSCQTEDILLNKPEEELDLWSTTFDHPKVVDGSSKLLLMYFCVADMSVELQSQGRSVAELQVTGVKASFTKRPYDANIAMSVHSLLLVDAMQTFGPNFELLVASHRHVMVDSVSGSLKGSEPVSPMSPGSPDPSAASGAKEMSPMEISKALASLQADHRLAHHHRAVSPPSEHFLEHGGSVSPMPVDILDPDALISVDVMIISPNCPSLNTGEEKNQEQLQIVSIQFNSLDVIANQETIVELLSFVKRVTPSTSKIHQKRRRMPTKDVGCQTTDDPVMRYPSLTSINSIDPFMSDHFSSLLDVTATDNR